MELIFLVKYWDVVAQLKIEREINKMILKYSESFDLEIFK
jgi:hypothetical protein